VANIPLEKEQNMAVLTRIRNDGTWSNVLRKLQSGNQPMSNFNSKKHSKEALDSNTQ